MTMITRFSSLILLLLLIATVGVSPSRCMKTPTDPSSFSGATMDVLIPRGRHVEQMNYLRGGTQKVTWNVAVQPRFSFGLQLTDRALQVVQQRASRTAATGVPPDRGEEEAASGGSSMTTVVWSVLVKHFSSTLFEANCSQSIVGSSAATTTDDLCAVVLPQRLSDGLYVFSVETTLLMVASSSCSSCHQGFTADPLLRKKSVTEVHAEIVHSEWRVNEKDTFQLSNIPEYFISGYSYRYRRSTNNAMKKGRDESTGSSGDRMDRSPVVVDIQLEQTRGPTHHQATGGQSAPAVLTPLEGRRVMLVGWVGTERQQLGSAVLSRSRGLFRTVSIDVSYTRSVGLVVILESTTASSGSALLSHHHQQRPSKHQRNPMVVAPTTTSSEPFPVVVHHCPPQQRTNDDESFFVGLWQDKKQYTMVDTPPPSVSRKLAQPINASDRRGYHNSTSTGNSSSGQYQHQEGRNVVVVVVVNPRALPGGSHLLVRVAEPWPFATRRHGSSASSPGTASSKETGHSTGYCRFGRQRVPGQRIGRANQRRTSSSNRRSLLARQMAADPCLTECVVPSHLIPYPTVVVPVTFHSYSDMLGSSPAGVGGKPVPSSSTIVQHNVTTLLYQYY